MLTHRCKNLRIQSRARCGLRGRGRGRSRHCLVHLCTCHPHGYDLCIVSGLSVMCLRAGTTPLKRTKTSLKTLSIYICIYVYTYIGILSLICKHAAESQKRNVLCASDPAFSTLPLRSLSAVERRKISFHIPIFFSDVDRRQLTR